MAEYTEREGMGVMGHEYELNLFLLRFRRWKALNEIFHLFRFHHHIRHKLLLVRCAFNIRRSPHHDTNVSHNAEEQREGRNRTSEHLCRIDLLRVSLLRDRYIARDLHKIGPRSQIGDRARHDGQQLYI